MMQMVLPDFGAPADPRLGKISPLAEAMHPGRQEQAGEPAET